MKPKGVRLNRRQFLKTTAGAVTVLAFGKRLFAYYQSPGLQRWVQPLRGIGTIPVANSDGFKAPVTGVTHYTIDINEYTDILHPKLGPTKLWGYHPRVPLTGTGQKHLGGIIVAHQGVPIQITFQNNLPAKHPLPVDTSAFFQDVNLGANRTAVHLHGGLVHWISDGGPFDWWLPNGTHGSGFYNNQVLNPNALAGQAEYYYPNSQSARLVWYHDHAHDTTRINAYAGIASAYIIRDNFETSLIKLGLPNFIEAGGNEIPIVVQDKIFVDANTIAYFDPDWTTLPVPQTTGSLWYPHFYDYKRWTMGPGVLAPPAGLPPKPVSCIPEMFGDTMLVNGTAYPEAAVEPRRYRLRILNACNARFLNLQTYVEDPLPPATAANPLSDGITLNPATQNPTNKPGPDFLVIGTEGGFLQNPVVVNAQLPFNPITMQGSLITAPAERWDILIDFSKFAGQNIILYNDAPAPFPGGDPLNDAYWNGPGSVTHSGPGFSPCTRQLLRFKVGTTVTAPVDLPLRINRSTLLTKNLDPFLMTPGAAVKAGAVAWPATIGGKTVKVRRLTLNEDFDEYGRLMQWIGTDTLPTPTSASFGRAYMDGATEIVKAGDIEVWQIINLTADTHPMHFHLVNVQVLGRQAFDVLNYAGGVPAYLAAATTIDSLEYGWKETVRCNPGEVTTVIMQFNLPAPIPGVAIPLSNRVKDPAGNPVPGHEYVWHCHILEHEEHDMMRPLIVQ
jgi:spore coat protein A, manganese oxidase